MKAKINELIEKWKASEKEMDFWTPAGHAKIYIRRFIEDLEELLTLMKIIEGS